MRKTLISGAIAGILAIGIAAICVGAPGGSPGGFYDATAIHKNGAQTMTGGLTLTTGGVTIPTGQALCLDGSNCLAGAYNDVGTGTHYTAVGPLTLQPGAGGNNVDVALSGAGALTITSGQGICLDGGTCAAKLKWNAVYSTPGAAGSFTTSGNSYVLGDVDARAAITNGGAANGGSVAFNDPIRNLSTTTALFESSTSATAGVDDGFTLNTLATMAAGDRVLVLKNNGSEVVSMKGDGGAGFAGNINANAIYTQGGFLVAGTNIQLYLSAKAADGATAVGVVLDNSTTLATDGARIAEFRNNTTARAAITKDGFIRLGIGSTAAGCAPTACAAAGQIGTFCFVGGGTGVKDTAAVCAKDALDAYAWRAIY